MSSSGFGDEENNNSPNSNKNQSDLSIFCREVRNLLRSKPNCMIPFSKFVPAYHNHYGRQCCVYQFGYTKLIELLESIPHVVQIVGDGTNRYITLTHREQIKRFASDLIKVVKSQPGKKLKLSQFSRAYQQVLGRTFYVEDYGTNNINVLLAEIWEGTINIMPIKKELVDKSVRGPLFVNVNNNNNNNNNNNINQRSNFERSIIISKSQQQQQQHNTNSCDGSTSINNPNDNHSEDSSSTRAAAAASPSRSRENSILNQLVASCELVNKPYITDDYPDAWFEIPKRERSDKEIKRTKYFVWDVMELLSSIGPNYSVPFSKFIPSYHYYFNRQCKVSIFGFSKLIDLFESISPDVVEIIDQGPGEEKLIKLAEKFCPKSNSDCSDSIVLANSNKSNNGDPKLRVKVRGGIREDEEELDVENDYDDEEVEVDVLNDDDDDDDDVVVDDDDVEVDDMNDDYDYDEDDGLEGDDDVDMDDDDDDMEDDDDDDIDGDDVILPVQAIDNGPTEEELMELEDELKAYEELKAIQSKRSSRMAAKLGVYTF